MISRLYYILDTSNARGVEKALGIRSWAVRFCHNIAIIGVHDLSLALV